MRKKDIVTICMLSLVSFVSCDMNLLDRLIGTISEKFSEEEYYAGLRRRRQEQLDFALKFEKRFKKNRARREVIDSSAGRGARVNNKNIIKDEDVTNLQFVSPQIGVSAELTQKKQNASRPVVFNLMNPANIVLNSEKSSFDLAKEEKNKFSSEEGNQSIIMVEQQKKNESEQSDSVVEPQFDETKSDYASQKQENQIVADEKEAKTKKINEIKSKIDSELQSINSFNDSFSQKLSELDSFKSEISHTKSKIENFNSDARQIVDAIVAQRYVGTDNLLSLDQFLQQVSNNIINNIELAKALYQNKIVVLAKAKVDLENSKEYINDVNILKAKDTLSSVENIIEQKIRRDLSSLRIARSDVKKRLDVFKEFIVERLEKFDSIVKAGSYSNLDGKLKSSELKHAQRYMREEINETNIYKKVKEDNKQKIESFLRSNYKYLLGS